ncbi:MAG: MFS transporter [Methanocalculus sp. MSAO_Arc1]|uniref:MFS transporter n=1 Tax=Methanocalculus TaxID=71151 RepID=UPI000FF4C473|nr:MULTISPECIES: MFS transporter [unclassified Methanocalculus]MCP1662762.1 MFS family permease [Methanocalculus sp. AMF5]RQD81945.1 MAG: MFS transporter [Methanocalculus sp. MSAO_Arc1]
MIPRYLPALAGVFSVMALSNAVVPVLPVFGEGSALQGIIFSAYFFGALVTVFPAGLLADKIGARILIRIGLGITVICGVLLVLIDIFSIIVLVRLIEGIAAGLFLASAMSVINADPNHKRLSGFFMGSLNAGLLAGLAGTGWIVSVASDPRAGLAVFTLTAVGAFLLSLGMRQETATRAVKPSAIPLYLSQYRWLWYSIIILVGTTGAATALYPEFGGHDPLITGFFIASMNLATMIAVLVVSNLLLDPVTTIRVAALGMAVSVLICLYTPIGFPLMGAFAGVAIISQMAFLAETGGPQGALMGLFNTASYGGLSLLPFATGFIAEYTSFTFAFLAPALFAVTVAVFIGRCQCRLPA